MSRLRLSSEARVVVLLTALIVLFSVGTVLTGRDAHQDRGFPQRSTYSSEPHGCKALWLTVQTLGHDVSRLRRPWTEMPDGADMLFVLSPSMTADEGEWDRLLTWVDGGGLLVWAREQREFQSDEAAWTDVASTVTGGMCQGAPALRVLEKPLLLASYPRISRRLQLWDKAWPIYAQGNRTAVSFTPCGRGAIVEVESPEALSNEGLARGENLRFMLNLVAQGTRPQDRAGARRIVFDEYHHGYGYSPGGTTWRSLPAPVQTGLLQLLAAALLLIWVLSRRLSPPRALPPPPRERSEYLASLAGLLQRGRAYRQVIRLLRRQLLDGARQHWGALAGSSDDALRDVVERQRSPQAQEMRALLARMDVWERGTPPEPDQLLSAAVAVHRILNEMRRTE